MKILKPEKIIEEISNLKTGEKYKNDEEWKAKGIPESLSIAIICLPVELNTIFLALKSAKVLAPRGLLTLLLTLNQRLPLLVSLTTQNWPSLPFRLLPTSSVWAQ